MSETDKLAELRSVLVEAAKSGKTVRLFGPTGSVITEGKIVSVGTTLVALKHGTRDEPEEYVLLTCLTRVQFVPEPRTF